MSQVYNNTGQGRERPVSDNKEQGLLQLSIAKTLKEYNKKLLEEDIHNLLFYVDAQVAHKENMRLTSAKYIKTGFGVYSPDIEQNLEAIEDQLILEVVKVDNKLRKKYGFNGKVRFEEKYKIEDIDYNDLIEDNIKSVKGDYHPIQDLPSEIEEYKCAEVGDKVRFDFASENEIQSKDVLSNQSEEGPLAKSD